MDSGLRRLLQQLKARRAYKEETITLNMCSVFLIDIALIFIGVAGLFMDRKKVNLLGRGKEEIELAQLPNDSADVSRQEVTKLEQSSEAGTQRTFDPAEALPTKQITFMQVLKRYNRVVTLFYGEALPRPLRLCASTWRYSSCLPLLLSLSSPKSTFRLLFLSFRLSCSCVAWV